MIFRAPVRDADTPEALGPGHAAIEKPMAPSPYFAGTAAVVRIAPGPNPPATSPSRRAR